MHGLRNRIAKLEEKLKPVNEDEIVMNIFIVEYPGGELNSEVYPGSAEPVPKGHVRIGYSTRSGNKHIILPEAEAERWLAEHDGLKIILNKA